MAAAEPDGPEVFAIYRGVKIPAGPYLNARQRDWLKDGSYEAREVNCALRTVREGERVLELGTGIGVVSGIIAVNCNPSCVLSYEPNAALIPAIRALHALNGLEALMRVENAVVLAGEALPARVSFDVRSNFLGSRLAGNSPRGEVVEVDAHDFAEVKADFRPDVILMDTEGAELDFLAAADLSDVRALVIEFHPKIYGMEGVYRCKSLLRAQGFEKGPGSSPSVWAAVRTGATVSEETQLPQQIDH